jgi:hypothetical protein
MVKVPLGAVENRVVEGVAVLVQKLDAQVDPAPVTLMWPWRK